MFVFYNGNDINEILFNSPSTSNIGPDSLGLLCTSVWGLFERKTDSRRHAVKKHLSFFSISSFVSNSVKLADTMDTSRKKDKTEYCICILPERVCTSKYSTLVQLLCPMRFHLIYTLYPRVSFHIPPTLRPQNNRHIFFTNMNAAGALFSCTPNSDSWHCHTWVAFT